LELISLDVFRRHLKGNLWESMIMAAKLPT